MTYAELFDLYSKSQEQKEKAFDYLLKERHLQEHAIQDCGYLYKVPFQGRYIYDVIVMPIFDSKGNVSMLECRGIYKKRYIKYISDKTRIPIYINYNKLDLDKPIILVEGILEAKTIESYSSKIQVASSVRASMSKAQLLYLSTISDNIIVLFNNDNAGFSNAEKVLEKISNFNENNNFIVECLPDETDAIDLNEFLSKDKDAFLEYLNYLEKEYYDEHY